MSRTHSLQRHIQRFGMRQQRLEKQSQRFTWIRLTLAGGTLLLASVFFVQQQALYGWSVVGCGVLLFAGVVRLHRRLKHGLLKQILWLRYKQQQLARINIDWEHLPPYVADSRPPNHPFEQDLDITGPQSLLHVLDTCISLEGRERLRAWLLETTPDPEAILQRQQGVKELLSRAYFREQLWLQIELTKQTFRSPPLRYWKSDTILHWFQNVVLPPLLSRWFLWLSGLSVLNMGLFAAHTFGWLTLAWWKFSWAVYGLVFFLQRRYIVGLFDRTLVLDQALDQLKTILTYLEHSYFPENTLIAGYLSHFQAPSNRPSQHISRLRRILAAASLQHNLLVWFPLNALVPWDFYCSWRLWRWRHQLQDCVPLWLDSIWQLEALAALANWAWLNPEHVFPSWNVSTVMSCKKIGHPLIPPDKRVYNDFHLENWGSIHLITGSNMAGKSTFLRTLGINLVLAHAGAPVLAQVAALPQARLFACLQISDSVTDGLSYFYAEVKRLKALLDALNEQHSLPLFFLIDEIFRGTNNRERLLGSQAYLHALLGHQGAGLVSTHDLELIKLAEQEPRIQNFHFCETIENAQMRFDYRLRPGPCPTTNALRIMALEGLPVTTTDI